jgi:hypothetical protein
MSKSVHGLRLASINLRASKLTAVDFFDDLTSPYARKRFFWGFVAFSVLCIIGVYLSRLFLYDGVTGDLINEVLLHVLADALVVLAFYALYMHFIGPNEELREISVTRPRDIREQMEQMPVGTRFYAFWGRSGSYFRSHPLLALDKQSREQKLVTDVEIVLPDPTDARLIQSYRDILNSLGENTGNNPLLANVLATSIACAIVSAKNKYINIKLFYSKFLPTFRVDISDKGAILTQDDPSKSALFFQPESEFYEMLRTTVRNEIAVSREVKWDQALFSGRHLDDAKLCDEITLGAFGIGITDPDSLRKEVGKLIAKRWHRYK